MRRWARVRTPNGELWAVVRESDQKLVLMTESPWAGGKDSHETHGLRDLPLLPPVAPTKIVAVGRNYRAHAEELGNAPPPEPLLFLKPPSAIVGPGAPILLPPEAGRVEHEGELAIVIGRRARRVKAADAMAHVFGLTCANDVTARDLQKKDGQWTRAKGFDTFCPLGPFLVEGLDPGDRTVVTRVNGVERQRGHTASLLFPVPVLVEYVSGIMTLEPGDLILTGTPAGVSPLAAGDVVQVEIDGIGVLENPVTSGTVPAES